MDNYIVSARKYRPTTFDDVVGQGAITSTLQKAIKNNHLAQALLFCGPRGVGKTTCARILAKAINQDTFEGELDPNEDFSFNIFELDAASNNSVDDIRNLIDQVRFSPQQGKFKVYIIDEVHMLSQAAFNAFLKTLEEPPAHAIFILATTEKHKIIPTILSRCQIFDFRRIMVSDMVSHLANIAKKEGVDAEEEALHVVAEKADGALRDALSIFDRLVTFSGNTVTYQDAIENLNILDYDYYFRATDLTLQGDIAGSMLLFNEVLERGFNGHEFINGLASHFRNLLMCKDASTVQLLEVSEKIQQKYLEQAQRCAPLNLLKGLRIMNECDVQYKSSKNQRLTVELALMKMCALHKVPEGAAPAAPEKKKSLAEATPKVETPALEQTPSEPIALSVQDYTPVIKVETPQSEVSNEIPREEDDVADTASAEEQKEEVNSAEIAQVSKTISLKSRRRIRGTGVRISEAHLPVEEEIVNPEDLPKDGFTESEMQKIWNDRVNLLFRGKPSILSSLTKNPPKLKEDHTIELELDGAHQLEQLQETRSVLVEAIRKDLNNFSIQLETPVKEVIVHKKAYTPKEVYHQLVQENPNLELLREQLGLDLDF
ncbi:MAG: DNA polymerase III subunit gamma/tau [Flavobacteriales bacterium]|nr:DNA polymerase III subunit gamma/tau [Flavobacteriales bacterium]